VLGDRSGDVDDSPPAGGEHSWQYALGNGHRGDHVDCHRSRHRVRVGIVRRAERPHHRRIVDQQLDRTEFADQSLESAARLVGVADVGGERYRGATVVLDLGGDLVEVTLSASEQSHPYAPAPEADRDCPADTAAGSGDESRSPVERGGHCVPPGVVGVVAH
jgi:hypothetical protein